MGVRSKFETADRASTPRAADFRAALLCANPAHKTSYLSRKFIFWLRKTSTVGFTSIIHKLHSFDIRFKPTPSGATTMQRRQPILRIRLDEFQNHLISFFAFSVKVTILSLNQPFRNARYVNIPIFTTVTTVLYWLIASVDPIISTMIRREIP